jgi:hypothetical protein
VAELRLEPVFFFLVVLGLELSFTLAMQVICRTHVYSPFDLELFNINYTNKTWGVGFEQRVIRLFCTTAAAKLEKLEYTSVECIWGF